MRHSKLLLIILLSMGPSHVFSTTIRLLDLDALSQKADMIVRANVLRVESQPSASNPKILVSIVTLNPLEILKPSPTGSPNLSPIKIRYVGGTSGHQRLYVPGSPTFEPNQDVVVFLERAQHVFFSVLGMAQGKFDVWVDPETKAPWVKRNNQNLLLVTNNHSIISQGLRLSGTSDDFIPYDTFKSIVLNNAH